MLPFSHSTKKNNTVLYLFVLSNPALSFFFIHKLLGLPLPGCYSSLYFAKQCNNYMFHPFSFLSDYVTYITAATLTSEGTVNIATFGLNDTFCHFPYKSLRPRNNLEEEFIYGML